MSFGPPEETGDGYDQPPSSPPSERTTVPGIFLVVVGVLNIFGGGFLALLGFAAANVPTEELQKQMEKQQPQNIKEMEKAGITVKTIQDWYQRAGYVGLINCVIGVVIILGGIMLWTRKNYALAIVGALLAAIPVLSLSSCPCIFGLGIGIWAMVVLSSAEGKAAFR
jgi:hypothetical protein